MFPALADRKSKHIKNHYTNMMFYIHFWRKYKKVMLKPLRFPYVLNSYISYIEYMKTISFHVFPAHHENLKILSKTIIKPDVSASFLRKYIKVIKSVPKPCANLYILNGCAPKAKHIKKHYKTQ